MASCQALVSSDVFQCSTTADCQARGASFAGTTCIDRVCANADSGVADAAPSDPVWGCLGKVSWPPELPTEKIRYERRLVRIVTPTPVAGVRIVACGALDPECAGPVAETKSDDNGVFVIDLPRHFRGYLHLPEPPASFPAMLPHIIHVLPPPAADTKGDGIDTQNTFVIVSDEEVKYLLQQVGKTFDPTLGHVSSRVFDCSFFPAARVSMRVSVVAKETVGFYVPSSGIPSTTLQQTDETGFGGFSNLPTGVIDVETFVLDKATRGARVSTLVKKGAMTILALPVTP